LQPSRHPIGLELSSGIGKLMSGRKGKAERGSRERDKCHLEGGVVHMAGNYYFQRNGRTFPAGMDWKCHLGVALQVQSFTHSTFPLSCN